MTEASEQHCSRYLNLIKNCLLNTIYGDININTGNAPTDFETENGGSWPKNAHTMIGQKRLNNIQRCAEDIFLNKIPGDFIETGVWRGGATIFMKACIENYEEKSRRVFVADSFCGLPPPEADRYPADANDPHHTIKYLAVPLDEVKNNFKKYDLLDENVVFIEGFFEESLPKQNFNALSMLRLDGDMYSSTIQVLNLLYDKVSKGGYIIIDDYALPACRKAVDDFRQARGINSPMEVVDHTGRSWKKE